MYDIIIIGAGPGGYVAAERAGMAGKKVLLVEKSELGGECLNAGCIPTKSLLNSAKLYRHALEGESFGVTVEGAEFHLDKAMEWKNKTVKTLQKGIAWLMKKAEVDVVSGEAEVESPGKIRVNNTLHECDSLIIASGSRPAVPPIPGAGNGSVMTNRELVNLTVLPETVAVIGGGVIGMEFASFFSSLGKEVNVFEMLPEVLPLMEKEHAAIMRSSMKGVAFHLGVKVEKIEGRKLYFVSDDENGSVEADLILAATGRVPNTDIPGLERLKLDITRKGISVNDKMETNVPGVYAVGDVTGTSLLAHSASRMGEVAVNTILGNSDRMRYDAVPWAVYTLPEAAGCGLTEEQAKDAGYDVETATYGYRGNGRALAEGHADRGVSKIIADRSSGRIVGIHLVGPYASENIYGASAMLETDFRVRDLRETVFPHPTVSEVIREAAFMLKI